MLYFSYMLFDYFDLDVYIDLCWPTFEENNMEAFSNIANMFFFRSI